MESSYSAREQMEQIPLHEKVQQLLCEIACYWIIISIEGDELNKRIKIKSRGNLTNLALVSPL